LIKLFRCAPCAAQSYGIWRCYDAPPVSSRD
jgi:hypothetical protein